VKTLVFANQKGGVGKSAIACQFAFYLSQSLHKRVLFIDLDHQRNASAPILLSGLASVASFGSHQIFSESLADVTAANFVLIPATKELLQLEKLADRHNAYATALRNFLRQVDAGFDVCIVDTNPNPDIRMIAALVVADFVLSPIQLNQEALNGIGALSNDIINIRSKLNRSLHWLGILPNLVESTPFQKNNLRQLLEHHAQLLLRLENGQFAMIPTRTAIAEAQAAGKPVWQLGKTSARTAWGEMGPVFARVAQLMEEGK
jgi:chromosome partitioning protein